MEAVKVEGSTSRNDNAEVLGLKPQALAQKVKLLYSSTYAMSWRVIGNDQFGARLIACEHPSAPEDK